MFKGGKSAPPALPRKTIQVAPVPEQQKLFEINFPNVVGYRVENKDGEIRYDFSGVENYEIDATRTPTEATMASAFSPHEEKIEVKSVLEKRDNEIIFLLTKELIKYHFSDGENPKFQFFNRLKRIVEEWYQTKVRLVGIRGDQWKKLLYFHTPKPIVDHIARGINTHLNTTEHIRPVFNYYNQFGSTKYAGGITTKDVYATKKSHINYVVEDSGWEGIAAKAFEEMPEVERYVKNQFLDFKIPYVKEGKDRDYFPDFIVGYRAPDGSIKNLIVEISGMSKDKAEKKWYVENRWLPAVNAVKDKFDYPEWSFIEIEGDIRDIKNQLIDKFQSI